MSGERITSWVMVAIGLVVWAIAIPLHATWLMVAGAVIVTGGVFQLLMWWEPGSQE